MDTRKSYFYYIKFLMMIVGIWGLSDHNSSRIKKKFYATYSVLFQLVYLSAMVSLSADLPSLLKTNSPIAMENMGRFIFCLVTMIKMVMCRSKGVLDLIEDALRQDRELFVQDDTEIGNIYRWHVNFDNKIISLIVTSAALVSLSIAVIGDANAMRRFKKGNATESPLPLHYWYPFNTDKYFTFVIIDQNVRPTLVLFCLGVVSAFVNCLIIFMRAQLMALQFNFRHFHQYRSHRSPEDILKLLCIKHQGLIKCIGQFNASLKNIILLEYTIVSITFGTVILQITAKNQIVVNSLALIFTTIQLLAFSWSSNEIIVQSSELAVALFESNWCDQNKQTKKLIQIMMMRCQRPLCLRIGQLGLMDLNAGMSRLKLGYSYTSVMSKRE
ncbi:odorant receptor 30a-like isoform X3 [Cylas formicarius]|uniref:odorant receptor 30a-like isoform X3 n=1 Tax=Cylas formicarius TaxID=197179 RepID=UPI002958791E|nr:odorant receptor 30a-like isoform X3 [Cylas formicarius]XP_060532244.1 odorant receptor 30a-like isoform X3 [Cylas formicarius]